jgi:hypothetical protein
MLWIDRQRVPAIPPPAAAYAHYSRFDCAVLYHFPKCAEFHTHVIRRLLRCEPSYFSCRHHNSILLTVSHSFYVTNPVISLHFFSFWRKKISNRLVDNVLLLVRESV